MFLGVEFKKLVDTGAKTVRIVKPYADNAKVKDQMQYAESVGAFGIGMDIDHIFDVLSKYDMSDHAEEEYRKFFGNSIKKRIKTSYSHL